MSAVPGTFSRWEDPGPTESASDQPTMPDDEASIIIIGAGTFGTSTAYHLAKRYADPSKIIVVDRAPSPPKPAASIDINRIIRPDYPNSLYCNLAWEAIHSWFWGLELQQFFHQTGGIMMFQDDGADKAREVFKGRGYDQTETVPLDQLESHAKSQGAFTGTSTHGFKDAYFNPDAGWVNAAKATASYMHEAQKYGVQRLTAEITELTWENERLTGVRTADGQHLTADKILLASGAWTSSLLSPIEDTLSIPAADRIERQIRATGVVSAYYKLPASEIEPFIKAPVVMYGELGQVIPASLENETVKYTNSTTMFTNSVTTASGVRITQPAERSQYDVPEALKRKTEELIVQKVMPEFARGKTADHWRICWDARTADRNWLCCRHPHGKLGNLYLAVGGSFQAYKFLPNSGKYIRNVLNGKSNGREKDQAWAWKKDPDEEKQCKIELKEFDERSEKSQARL